MNQAEYLGAQLTMLIRREFEQERALQDTRDKINQAYIEIQSMEAGQLYGSTGEIPRVVSPPASPSEAVTEMIQYGQYFNGNYPPTTS